MTGGDQSDDRRGQRTGLTEPNRTEIFPPVSKSVNIPKVEVEEWEEVKEGVQEVEMVESEEDQMEV